MKKVLLSLALVGLLALALGFAASAASADPVIIPSVTRVEPASAYNDIDTHVTITGADFALETSGDVTTTPTVALGSTQLTDVSWVDSSTLSATVPWGMNAGTYDLTVTNPDRTPSTPLARAFEVKLGIGQWNPGTLNGGSVRQLLMKPGDPQTIYALAYGVGLFRSQDAGEHWKFVSGNVIGNSDFTLDPHNPEWLYCAASPGLEVSKDEGDTWTLIKDTSGAVGATIPPVAEVYVSPHDPNVLFFATFQGVRGVIGLEKSTNAGATWAAIPSMAGTSVKSVAFDPTDSKNMVLATADARVFKSSDVGLHWTEVTPKPPLRTLGMDGYIMYNPYKPSEIWITSTETDGGMYKNTDGTLTDWIDVAPFPHGGYRPSFASADSVYLWHFRSDDGGRTWRDWGYWPWPGGSGVLFSPGDTSTIYAGDAMYGVRKTIDGGETWDTKNNGLMGMRCVSMQVSSTDPLRVYAAFEAWPGIFRSDNGTSDWRFIEIPGSGQVRQVLEDPFDPGRLFASADGGVYVSESQGETWTPLGKPPGSEAGMLYVMRADPHQPGHLLVGARFGASSLHDHDTGLVFSSSDWGKTWASVAVATPPGVLAYISDITFDPDTTGTIYVATGGTGLWRSTDDGDTWSRIDDVSQPFMAYEYGLAIATHPQRVLFLSGDSGRPFRSYDNGATWVNKENSGEVSANMYLFVDGDSTRLYAPDWNGLHFSSDLGNTWTSAAGVLGHVQVTQVTSTDTNGHTILYAASTGGSWIAPNGVQSNAVKSGAGKAASASSIDAAATGSTVVGAGIYRRAQVAEPPRTSRSSGGQDGWVLESSHTSSRGGKTSATASTLRLGDDASKKQYRDILSFNTSGIPDGAVITGVTLKVKKQGVTGGGDPVAKFSGFMVDIKNGFFGTSSALQTGDFQAAASKTYGSFKPSLVGGWYSIGLTGAKGSINKLSSHSGLTQIRLRFKLDDNNNRTANYLSLYSGNASTSSRPQLIVTYYMP